MPGLVDRIVAMFKCGDCRWWNEDRVGAMDQAALDWHEEKRGHRQEVHKPPYGVELSKEPQNAHVIFSTLRGRWSVMLSATSYVRYNDQYGSKARTKRAQCLVR